MMKKNLAFVPLIAFLVFSCGRLESPKKKTEAIKSNQGRLTEEKFREKCLAARGILDSGLTLCLTQKFIELPSYETLPAPKDRFEITEKFYSGMFLEVSGTSAGKVQVIYDDVPVKMDIPSKTLASFGDGKKLAFFVTGSGYSAVTANVWTCFDTVKTDNEEMRRVVCPPSLMPK